jgi:serine phosphatase RsbU (regulator of sigma subunit)
MEKVKSTVVLTLVEGPDSLQLTFDHSPFTLGRMPGCDCLVRHKSVSRDHAILIEEEDGCYVVDRGSSFGTYVNGERVDRRLLHMGDKIQLGSLDGPVLKFGISPQESTARINLLPELKAIAQPASDLERLKWFLEVARKMNEFGAVDEILSSLVEVTLQLTKVERGFVFLSEPDGELKLVVGRGPQGPILEDDFTISRTAIQQAMHSASKFIVTDTMTAGASLRSDSIVAHSIRSVICIPLRRRSTEAENRGRENMGVLYLDSRLHAGNMTAVEHDLLETIAKEAAALVENAFLLESEAAARSYRAELAIASQIQQGLMRVQVPKLGYAQLSAKSIPCLEIGGDFYDVIEAKGCLYVVIADISGKGISAALLASTLQGMLYAQILAGQSLTEIAAVANQYITGKDIGKYATMVLLKMAENGEVEYLNCGHIKPLVVHGNSVKRLPQHNLVVGLLFPASYESATYQMTPGERLLLVTDGVTEAQNCAGDFLGEEELERFAIRPTLDEIFGGVQAFLSGCPNGDDCTIVEIRYGATA